MSQPKAQDDVYYQAMLARDYRFDGKFFVAVKTTGIYCRPICPAKPKRQNVVFYASAALAEKGGYRPCLRCRPESAPLSPAWFGKSAVVQRALRLIAANQLHAFQEDRFAEQFGMTARHLRRLFEQEIGQTPKQISDNNRLNFARKLVVETSIPMTIVAESAGFSSLRRFNDAFKKRFTKAPSALRKNTAAAPSERGIELELAFRPPYDWAWTRHFYESHPAPGIDAITDDGYERVFRLDGQLGWFRVSPAPHALKLRVVTEDPKILFAVVARVRKMFDLDSDPLLVANCFAGHAPLEAIYLANPGLRIPRGWDAFETAIGTVLGQLVSVEHATALKRQLIEAYGEEIRHPVSGESARLFPTPKALARADLKEVKTTAARKATIRALSEKARDGELDLSDAQDPAGFRKALLAIPGIGPWSAEYISLRAIGDTDAFPATDLILKRAIELHPSLDLDAIRPWRSYAAMYLWKGYAKKLSKRKEAKP